LSNRASIRLGWFFRPPTIATKELVCIALL